MIRKNNTVLLVPILSIVIILLITIFLSILQILNQEITISIFLGEILAFINFISGIFFINLGYNKNNNNFLLFTFGGMVFRMLVMLILIGVIIKFLKVNIFYFIFILFILYFYFLILEIIYLLKLYNRISPKRE